MIRFLDVGGFCYWYIEETKTSYTWQPNWKDLSIQHVEQLRGSWPEATHEDLKYFIRSCFDAERIYHRAPGS